MNAQLVLKRLRAALPNGSCKPTVPCPAHDDRNPSLSVRLGEDGRVLVFCHSGCQLTEIVAAVGLEVRDLFPDEPYRRRQGARRLCRTAARRVVAPRHDRLPPPPGEADGLWSLCTPVTEDREVVSYLAHRRIAVDRVEELDLARALPVGVATPAWASTWARHGYRLIVPVFNIGGQLSSFRARSVRLPAPHMKTMVPTGYSTAGLVLADVLARRLLAGDLGADVGVTAAKLVVEAGLWIAEGEIDFLTLATSWCDCDVAPAVIGVTSGAWTPEHGGRVPAGAIVTVATDADSAGDRYAAGIVTSLPSSVTAYRWGAG